jgi:hypothetical protein
MTIAICMNCGEEKWGAFNPCEKCGFHPRTEGELVWSICVSDHYLNKETMREIGDKVKIGEVPTIDSATHNMMIEQLRETGLMKMMRMSPQEEN